MPKAGQAYEPAGLVGKDGTMAYADGDLTLDADGNIVIAALAEDNSSSSWNVGGSVGLAGNSLSLVSPVV